MFFSGQDVMSMTPAWAMQVDNRVIMKQAIVVWTQVDNIP
jgi:hypothetical protein